MLSFTNQHQELGPKDTLRNIEDTGHFVVNIVTHELFEQMNLTSAELPRKENEFEFAQIKSLSSNFGGSLRVEGSPIQLECKYIKSVDLPKVNTELVNRMIIGVVIGIHIDKDILTEDNRINYSKVKFIARLGYNDYLMLNPENIFKSTRPKS